MLLTDEKIERSGFLCGGSKGCKKRTFNGRQSDCRVCAEDALKAWNEAPNLEMENGMQPIPTFGKHMTMKEFKETCLSGAFNDDDGFGYYATSNRMSKKVVHPSNVNHHTIDMNVLSFTHVVWFNK